MGPVIVSEVLMAGFDEEIAASLERRLGNVGVRATPSVRATLQILASPGWSLLILNHRVGDDAAQDVLAEIRSEPGLEKLPVLCCLEQHPSSALATRLVDELGVVRLLFHPLDLEELAQQVADILGVSLPASQPDEDAAQQANMMAMAGLWEQFKDAIVGRISIFDHVCESIVNNCLTDTLREEARAEAHKLTGSVGSVGFFKAARLTREIEHLLQGETVLDRAAASALTQLTIDLRQELDQGPVDQAAERVSYDSRPLLLVVDDDLELTRRLAADGTRRGLRVETATGPVAAREFVERTSPDVVLLDLSFPHEKEDGLALLAELTGRTPPVPVLVLTVREGPQDRVEVARRGGGSSRSRSQPRRSSKR
jgi:DNA-binding response OmpR family regulator